MGGWSRGFTEALAKVQIDAFKFVVREVQVGIAKGGAYGVASHENLGLPSGLKAGSVRVAGSSLTMRGWGGTAGGFSFTLTRTAMANVNVHWTGGSVLELLVGLPGMTLNQFERLALGWLDTWVARKDGAEYEFTCLDLASLLQSRLATKASEARLFYNLPGETVAEVTGVVSTTVTLDDASLFEKSDDNPGAFKTAAGTYYKYTGKSGNDLTGVTLLDGTAGTPLTTTQVQPVAYLTGHPVSLAMQVLVSTGVADKHGYSDVLPKSWGYGLPGHLVDYQYSRAYSGDVGSAALTPLLSDKWHVIVDEPVANGWSWLKSWLNPAGLFIDQRQGQLIVSAVQTPHIATRIQPEEIVADQVRTSALEGLDQQSVGEYGEVLIDFDGDPSTLTSIFGTPASEEVATLPVLDEQVYFSYNGFVPSQLTSGSERTDVGNDVAHRVARYYTRRGERLHVTLGGFMAARFHRGQVLRVTLPQLVGRLPTSRRGLDRHRMMITKLSVELDRSQCSLQLVAVPPDESRFYKSQPSSTGGSYSASFTKSS